MWDVHSHIRYSPWWQFLNILNLYSLYSVILTTECKLYQVESLFLLFWVQIKYACSSENPNSYVSFHLKPMSHSHTFFTCYMVDLASRSLYDSYVVYTQLLRKSYAIVRDFCVMHTQIFYFNDRNTEGWINCYKAQMSRFNYVNDAQITKSNE